jgi:CheY-like chemotaxis protein
MVREHEPDVILLDAMLPEIHGFDICRGSATPISRSFAPLCGLPERRPPVPRASRVRVHPQ